MIRCCGKCKYKKVERVKANDPFRTKFISNYYCNNDYSEWFCSSVSYDDACECFEPKEGNKNE